MLSVVAVQIIQSLMTPDFKNQNVTEAIGIKDGNIKWMLTCQIEVRSRRLSYRVFLLVYKIELKNDVVLISMIAESEMSQERKKNTDYYHC